MAVLWINNLSAQTRAYNFEKLNTSHGLSSNRITSIIQDRDGFYWIATEDGLNRFDGTSFKIYRNIRNDSSSLIHNYCTSLLETADGNIWVGTYNGISVFNKNFEKFERYTLHAKGIESSILNRITGLREDKNGNIWVAARGLWLFDKALNTFRLIDYKHPPENYRYYEVFSLQYDSLLHGFWFRTWRAIHYYDIAENKFYNFYNNEKKWKIFNRLHTSPVVLDKKRRLWYFDDSLQALCAYYISQNRTQPTIYKIHKGIRRMRADDQDRIWITFSEGGAAIYDAETKSVDSNFFKPVHQYSAAAEHFTDLFIDRQNEYWIGSYAGLSILKPEMQFYEIFPMPVSTYSSWNHGFSIQALAQKEKNQLFAATTDGLYLYDLGRRVFRKINLPGLSLPVQCLYYDKEQERLWIGCMDEVLIMDAGQNRIIRRIRIKRFPVFIIPYKHHIWIGTWASGLYCITPQGDIKNYFSAGLPGKLFLKTDALITGYTNDKSLWLGFNGGYGMAVLNPADSAFSYLKIEKSDEVESEVNTVTALAFDRLQNQWIGTYGGGLYCRDHKSHQYIQFLQSDGLRSNFIYNIIPDSQDNLWICHPNGVDYFISNKKKFIPLPFELVSSSTDFQNAAFLSRDSSLFFFNDNTIVRVKPPWNPASGDADKPVISSFEIFGKELPLGLIRNGARLTYKQNFFTIEFSQLRSNPAATVEYAYKLDGFDQDWNYSGTRNVASYTNVPGGQYVFRVKTITQTGEWSKVELTLPVVITPPFWKTWWFAVLAILVISGTLYLFYRYRINYLKKIMALRTKISQDLHDEIGSALSGIKIFSQLATDRPETVQENLKKINTYSDETIEKISDIVWSIQSENESFEHLIQKLRSYALSVSAARNMQLIFNVDPEIRKKTPDLVVRKNIYLIAKEAINNSVKYSGGSELNVSFRMFNNKVAITVSDNGKGFNRQDVKQGNGFINMTNRAAEIHAEFRIEAWPGRGTSISLICNT